MGRRRVVRTVHHFEGVVVKIESYQTAEDRGKWKIVRTDNYSDVPGDIITADEDTGECCVQVVGEPAPKTLSFGQKGIRIVGRQR